MELEEVCKLLRHFDCCLIGNAFDFFRKNALKILFDLLKSSIWFNIFSLNSLKLYAANKVQFSFYQIISIAKISLTYLIKE